MVNKKNNKKLEKQSETSCFCYMLLILVLIGCFVFGIEILKYYITAESYEISYAINFLYLNVAVCLMLFILFSYSNNWIWVILYLPFLGISCIALYSSIITTEQECSSGFFEHGVYMNLTEGQGCYTVSYYESVITDTEYKINEKCILNNNKGFIVQDNNSNYYCKIKSVLYNLN